jgi:CheY-like chemotaxis protein
VSKLPVVAVINTNPDLVELLKARIESAGLVVLVIHVAEIRAGLDIGAVMKQHQPEAIVYDVVMPYDRNWRFLQHLRETTLKDFKFVLTTPNAVALTKLVGRDEKVYEVLDDRGDLDAIVQAVREAVRARPTS